MFSWFKNTKNIKTNTRKPNNRKLYYDCKKGIYGVNV